MQSTFDQARIITITVVTLLLLGAYWFFTIMYVVPENPFRAQLQDPLTVFELYGYQKWTFFAPPPTFNNRLSITYTNRLTLQSVTYDPLTDVLNNKRSAGLFNVGEEALDYVLSGSIDQVAKYVSSHPAPGAASRLARAQIDVDMNLPGLKTLKRYASIIASAHGLDPNDQVVTIADFADFIPDIEADGKPGDVGALRQLRFLVAPFHLQK